MVNKMKSSIYFLLLLVLNFLDLLLKVIFTLRFEIIIAVMLLGHSMHVAVHIIAFAYCPQKTHFFLTLEAPVTVLLNTFVLPLIILCLGRLLFLCLYFQFRLNFVLGFTVLNLLIPVAFRA